MSAITRSNPKARLVPAVVCLLSGWVFNTKNTMELIERYAGKIQRFGQLPFQTEAVKKLGAHSAKHQRYALLDLEKVRP
ncbi:hypothetical protein [Pseudomonas laurylsulfatiphila]|uniref:hypothetical protein n=1 Tax=Pseudomonas laurylsulfatiphila TaxID=2011015 RepID=UPI003D26039D